jgi:hypothetical protein
MTEGLAPAYAMNPANMGTEIRECAGGSKNCRGRFRCFKTSLRTKCTPCYRINGETHCGRCAGTGRYVTSICNDVPIGPEGEVCYRCRGKGYQTKKDVARNSYYDNHYRGVGLYC